MTDCRDYLPFFLSATACPNDDGIHNARRITFEYAELKGINDSDEDVRQLVYLMRKYKLSAKLNLIPFNPWSGVEYEYSIDERIKRFSDTIYEEGISAPVRKPRGRDIMAARGWLKSASRRNQKRKSCGRKRRRSMDLIIVQLA